VAATRYDLALRQNSDFDLVVQAWADDAHTVVLNISGYSAKLVMRPTARSATVLDTINVAASPATGLTINGPAGQVTLHITAAQTLTYTWISGVYDLLIIGPTNNPQKCIAEGDVSVSSRVAV
jgi:hypothetical protein